LKEIEALQQEYSDVTKYAWWDGSSIQTDYLLLEALEKS
jgi:hypothetical protein